MTITARLEDGFTFKDGITLVTHLELPRGSWPLLARHVPAGFPSPADDYFEERIDLNAHLVHHKEATFFLRVEGDSMRDLGIRNGDLLVVDRSLEPTDGAVVIAVIDGEFTVKQLCRSADGDKLKAANPAYPDIPVRPEQDLVIWGVVRWSVHQVWPCSRSTR